MARSDTAGVTVAVAVAVWSRSVGSAVTVEVTVTVLVIVDAGGTARSMATATVKPAVVPAASVVAVQVMSPPAVPHAQPTGGLTDTSDVPAGTESLTTGLATLLGPLS